MNNLDLNKIRKEVKSKDDLLKLCNEKNLSLSEDELDKAYELLNSDSEELSLDDLDSISGGKSKEPIYGEKEYEAIAYVKYRCPYCKKKVWFPDGQHTQCPYCKRLQKYNPDCRIWC